MHLTIELVPSSCWGRNARSELSRSEWDIARRKCYKSANHRCEICGDKGRVEAHEIWEYDDNTKTQILKGLICLCKKCHEVKHYGRSQMLGKAKECICRIMEVNEWSEHQATDHIIEESRKWKERSEFNWTVDLSFVWNFLNEII